MEFIKPIRRYLHVKKRRYFMHKFASIALAKIYKVSNKNKIPIWLDYGTLLGAYRDKGFIAHDDDMDLGMYYDDFTYNVRRDLYDEGFTIIRQFNKINMNNIEDVVCTEITLLYKGLQIDLFFNFKEGDMKCSYGGDGVVKRNQWKLHLFKYPLSDFIKINFLGVQCTIPADTKDYLSFLYGESFMTPMKKGWKSRKIILPIEDYQGEMIGAWH